MAAGPTILIIDDEPNLRESLALILGQAGYKVTAAGGARQAREVLQTCPYDLAFLDIKMPEVDGMVLLQEFRCQYPKMAVLILTAHATLETAIKAVRHGAKDYLLKPIQPADLLARVHDILTSQQLPRRHMEIAAQVKALMAELSQETPSAGPAAPNGHLQTPDAGRFMRRGVLTLDLYAHQVTIKDRLIAIPAATFDYLATLLRHSPAPVTYNVLVKESQGYDLCQAEARSLVRGRMYELRKALEPNLRHPQYIITVRNVGYRLIT
jgi:DNA-binding response OmpR family regulator